MAEENGKGDLVVPQKNGPLADTGSGSTAESILKVLMTQLATISKAETVTGTPIQADKTTIIPVSKVSIGFAAGGSDAGGETNASSRRGKISVGGTGGGIQVEPIAFIVVGPDGKPQLLPIKGTINSVARVIDLIPDAISKIASMRQGKNAEAGAEEEAAPVRKRRPGTEED